MDLLTIRSQRLVLSLDALIIRLMDVLLAKLHLLSKIMPAQLITAQPTLRMDATLA
jgi:hypothetical protein